MDSMGALALATEKPSPQLLDRAPHGRERLLSMYMLRMIVGQSIAQLIILLIVSRDNSWASYICDCETGGGELSKKQKAAVFNTFVWMQIFNEVNCRTIKE